jgi:GNAT superfamily N-acetyltransferase
MKVRRATGEDIGFIAALWLELVAYHNALDPDLPTTTDESEEQYAHFVYRYMQRGDGVVFLAVDSKGAIVGYVFGMLTNLVPDLFAPLHGGMVVDLYVQADARRRGVGRALYGALVGWFRAKDVRTVEWDVAANNPAGRAFWQAVGGRDMMVRMQTKLDGDA